MTDYLFCYEGPQNIQLGIGKGHLAGVLLSGNSTSASCVIYDYAGAGPPAGNRIFMSFVDSNQPVVALFNDRFAPRFVDGAWLALEDNTYVMLWVHIPSVT